MLTHYSDFKALESVSNMIVANLDFNCSMSSRESCFSVSVDRSHVEGQISKLEITSHHLGLLLLSVANMRLFG